MNFSLENRNFVLFLLILNLIGVIASFFTYWETFLKFIEAGKWYLLPFIPISFILYLSMSLFLFFIYNGMKYNFLTIFTFYFNFVYGFTSILFYPLFIIFVDGFSYYHFWNIFAHGFLGLQSLLVLRYIKKIKLWEYFVLILIVINKDILDMFYGTLEYFVYYNFGVLKYFIYAFVIILQVLGIYLLFRKDCSTIKNI